MSHRQGEILIQVPVETKPYQIKRELLPYISHLEEHKLSQVTSLPINVWKLTVDFDRQSELDMISQLEEDGFFVACQLNRLAKRRGIPNDPDFDELWHHLNAGQDGGLLNVDFDAELAWDLATGGSTANGDEIVLAVLMTV